MQLMDEIFYCQLQTVTKLKQKPTLSLPLIENWVGFSPFWGSRGDSFVLTLVVSIGTNPTLKVKKVPMEYVPTMPKRLHFFGS